MSDARLVELARVMPTNAFVAADMLFTSVTKLEAAVAAGPVALFETGVGMIAPVIAGN